jgi:hypothetical protein
MSASVKIVSTLLAIRWKGKHKGSRSVRGVERQKQVPIPDSCYECRQPLLVELRFSKRARRYRATAWRSLAAARAREDLACLHRRRGRYRRGGVGQAGETRQRCRLRQRYRASLSIALGHDASKFDPDKPPDDISESNASKSGRRQA